MVFAASLVVHATPPEPDISPVVQQAPPGGDLREEVRALREELAAERRQQRLILEELRRNRPAPAPRVTETQMGSPAIVEAGEVVDEVVAFGNDVLVHGRVLGSATAFGGNVHIHPGGEVRGDAVSFGGQVLVEPGAHVSGDRVSLSGMDDAFLHESEPEEEGWLSGLYHRTMLLLSLLGAGILVVGLFPKRVGGVSREVSTNPVGAGFVGAAFSTLLLVLSVLFMLLTLGLGTPVSAVGVGVLGAAWLLGFVSVCQVIGDRLPMEQPNGRWAALLGGSFLFAFAGVIGFPGVLLAFLVSMVGVGAAVTSRFGTPS